MRIIDIANSDLAGENVKCYNPGIAKVGNKFVMAFRYEPARSYETEIALIDLDRHFHPVGAFKKLSIPRWSSKVVTIDDPRLIIINGDLIVVHAQAMLTAAWTWYSRVCVTAVGSGGTSKWWNFPEYGRPGLEKNWTPINYNNLLHFVYTINPLVVLGYPNIDKSKPGERLFPKMLEVSRAEPARIPWRHGVPCGGTNMVQRGEEFIGLFHSWGPEIEKPTRSEQRTYYVGAWAMTAQKPFRLTRMSRKPLMVAERDAANDLRGNGSAWHPNVIYPCGLLEHDGMLYASYGWQDCRCKIAEFTWHEVESGMDEISPVARGKADPLPVRAGPESTGHQVHPVMSETEADHVPTVENEKRPEPRKAKRPKSIFAL